MSILVVTGSSGLVGSECVLHFERQGWEVHGIDNNMRRYFFGPDGDTSSNLARLQRETRFFRHHGLDVRDRQVMLDLIGDLRPHFIIHCAAQPSHDLAASRPFDDFDVNAVGTHEPAGGDRATRSEAVFCLHEHEQGLRRRAQRAAAGGAGDPLGLRPAAGSRRHRREHADRPLPAQHLRRQQGRRRRHGAGVRALLRHEDRLLPRRLPHRAEPRRLSSCTASWLPGPMHRENGAYRIFGYKGKQVRDNIHSRTCAARSRPFHQNPRPGEVYNLGGGRANSFSVLEAIHLCEQHWTGR